MRIVAAALLIIPAPVIAAEGYFLKLLPAEGQYTRMDDGIRSVDVQTPQSVVRLIESRVRDKKIVRFVVVALNMGRAPFEIGPENVSVEMSPGSVVPVLSYEDMVGRERRRQKRQKFAMALSAMGRSMSASGAGYSSGTAMYNGNVYSPYGSATYNGTAAYQSYDPARAQAAQAIANAETRRDVEQMKANQAAAIGMLDFNLKTTTVDPGKVGSGPVQFDVTKEIKSVKEGVGYPVTVIVTLAGEEHRFAAEVRRLK